MSIDSELNEVTNNLLYSYDNQFNKLYNVQNSLDDTITNKDTLLNIENESLQQKDIYIKVLTDGIIFSLFILLLVYLYTIRIINIKLLILAIIIYIILYIIYFKFIFMRRINIGNKAYEKSFNLTNTINQEIKNTLANLIPPSTVCLPEEESNIPSYDQAVSTNNNILKINNPENVWQYGSIPEAGFTTVKYYKDLYKAPYNKLPIDRYTPKELKENQPQPWFNDIAPEDITYYNCVWNGPKNDTVNKATNITTTIPCSYFPNYKEVSKYIS
jgi:uncharacterized protein YdcH (DUF465 family)